MQAATFFEKHSHRPATGLGVEGAADAAETTVEIAPGYDALRDESELHSNMNSSSCCNNTNIIIYNNNNSSIISSSSSSNILTL
jgi:hypothetical protein